MNQIIYNSEYSESVEFVGNKALAHKDRLAVMKTILPHAFFLLRSYVRLFFSENKRGNKYHRDNCDLSSFLNDIGCLLWT